MRKQIWSVLVLLASLPAAAETLDCPREISTRQSLSGRAGGWEAISEKQSAHIRRMVDFYVGHPAKLVQLAPDNADSGKDPVWTVGPEDELWAVCRYTDTKVGLARKLGKGFRSCALKFNKQVLSQVDEASCQRH